MKKPVENPFGSIRATLFDELDALRSGKSDVSHATKVADEAAGKLKRVRADLARRRSVRNSPAT